MDYKIKQPLTKEFIEQDAKRVYSSNIVYYSFFTACFLFFVVFLLFYHCKISNEKPDFGLIFCCIIFLFDLVLLIYFIYIYFNFTHRYNVVIDRLVEVKRGWYWTYNPTRGILRPRASTGFYFSAHGRFLIDYNKTYYPWSQYYSMDGRSLKRTSDLGDDFYLVLIGKKIVCIYNKKMFELEDTEWGI